MREIVSPLSGIRSPFGGRVDPYKVLGFKPTLVADMSKDYYRNTARSTFDDLFTHSRLGNATMVDSDGLIKWAPHNLLTYSEDFSNAAWVETIVTEGTTDAVNSDLLGADKGFEASVPTSGRAYRANGSAVLVAGASYTAKIFVEEASGLSGVVNGISIAAAVASGDGHYSVSNGETGWVSFSFVAASSGATAFRVGIGLTGAASGTLRMSGFHLYRSDLGGMAPVPADARVAGSTTYVPTTSTAKYLPRRHNHVYNGSAWVDAGTLIETEARTNLLHTTDALVTQSATTTAAAHTLHFTGTGTVTLSGTSTAGPLVGTGTGEENRVSLTFTPTAGILILIVSGTVTDAQLEVGSTPSSYTPNLAASGTVTRAADTSGLTVDSSIVPWPTPKVIGDELVTNGTFDADTDWTLSAGATIADGALTLITDGTTTDVTADQAITCEVGKIYRISLDITQHPGGGAFLIRIGTSFGNGSTYQNSVGGVRTLTDFFVAKNTTEFIRIYNYADTAQTVTIDNISVKEINPLAVCISMKGAMAYADTGDAGGGDGMFFRWYLDADNLMTAYLFTGADIGFVQEEGNVRDSVATSGLGFTEGINVPFNIASRHGSTFINGAVDGTALTANTTPVVLPDLSSTDLQIGYDFMGNIKTVRIWTVDIGDTGIAEASA